MRLMIVGPLLALHLLQVSVLCLTPNELEAQKTGWQANLEKQYHIQTDEGPERYFRFQTLNGQYRKEKRLEDGTVIGTEGWVDPLGYLRIKDYIADAKGFRILKSKTIFMGKERTIHDAVVEVPRKVTNRPSRPIKLYRTPELRDLTSNSIEGSSSVAYVSSTLPPPSSPVRYGPIAITTLKPRPFTLPSRRSNELTSSSQIFAKKSYPLKPSPLVEAPPLPSLQVEHDDQNHVASSQDPATVRTLAPSRTFRGNMLYNGRTRNSSTTSSITSSIATSNDNINISNVSPAQPGPASRQPYRRTSTLLRSRSYPSSSTKWSSPAVTVPTSSEESNDVRIRQNVPAARIRTGFEYYLPKQYHEEGTSKARSSDADERAGSFGYVDPFGIRRVIYYKAGRSSGFKARLNNRYVGHDAAPFDPPAVAQQHAQH